MRTPPMHDRSAVCQPLLEEAVEVAAGQKAKPKKSGYGLLAKYGPGPSEEEIDESRREMFRGFAQDLP